MKTDSRLDDFAHDLCVSGLGIVFLCVVGAAVIRSEPREERSAPQELPASRSTGEDVSRPIEISARAGRP